MALSVRVSAASHCLLQQHNLQWLQSPGCSSWKQGRRLKRWCSGGRLLVHYNSHGLVSFKVCAQQQQRPSSSADNSDDEISSPAVFPSLQEESGGNGAEGGQGRNKTGNTRGDLSKLRYWLVTGLAAVGLAETSYLTWVKLYGGVPLPFIGLLAYGTVTVLGVWTLLNTGNKAREEYGVVGWLLLASTTAMAVASAYFMYILNVKLEGASCTYCVGSALLSLSLLLCTLKGFTTKDIRNVLSLQLLVGASVVVGLTVAFGDANSAFARGDIDLPPLEPEVSTSSSPKELSLAKHLRSIGAKMYGAFWCSHCFEQKQMFGKEAMKYVEYVECFPEGYRKGVQIAKACEAANIQGFPTWIINGQQFSGEQELSQLAEASGFDASKVAN
ncbi:hypothetical protein BDL97_04G102900 [Sphagnum fallax]|nr:hypothetical protein BDL97_04G102900 [Sphagnum fallax]